NPPGSCQRLLPAFRRSTRRLRPRRIRAAWFRPLPNGHSKRGARLTANQSGITSSDTEIFLLARSLCRVDRSEEAVVAAGGRVEGAECAPVDGNDIVEP